MKKYKGIIFDLDGVICSTDELHYQAWKSIADELHLHFDKSINDMLRGIGRKESMEIILKENHTTKSVQEVEELAAKKNEVYLYLLKNYGPGNLTDEVANTLKKVKDLGYKIAIGSSSKNAKLILCQLGIIDWFDVISDGTNITNTKPDPEVFIKAAEYLHLDISDCLVIEDAEVGIDAAIAGGFACAGIGIASKHKDVTYSLTTFSDLLQYI
ncbi:MULTISPECIES: beta-phosphoglucomutase [unclassified Breznakia]|uniref:beta-phosphoglucomutase n=1 Tax=unclassified Breznakia TaxID=2623764 RepID=UPI0024730BFF|nr:MULTISPECIES: beta-phosphoglucomutase [unclassified Breznakia]MDH6366789.1 beta-phosphoglucomutase [Breznakia sp. PH1-1]MDH6403824.1 beta-phosphoglucomutase [Breznakia sp. PF1-11]MDH6411533.1 beta-phosphoglucomutase [Breznakia sp. PFB1-11]MDH6413897.1 beta-phosphoglucomutase [Breznakia sp. PFB1-14]MDH6416326.1 beta-phosphoglucomutase [Breznakia sp. PFB1-4]